MKLRLRIFLQAKSANSLEKSAPGRARIRDPRLRRAVAHLRSGFGSNDLRRYAASYPRGIGELSSKGWKQID
jgi:hypothetical protein